MKKNGFTLAEVLITLAIIGVVATLTLPALMTNTAEQQAKTAFKKGINTLTEAAHMNQAINGFDYASLAVAQGTPPSPDEQSLYGLLATRANLDFARCKLGAHPSFQGNATDANSGNYTVFFRDGSTLSYNPSVKSDSQNGANKGDALQDDGLVYGITALFDTNGAKGPNILSNCLGAAMGAATDSTDSAAEVCTRTKRVIKDQFGVRLRNGYAVPNGAAARWAYEE